MKPAPRSGRVSSPFYIFRENLPHYRFQSWHVLLSSLGPGYKTSGVRELAGFDTPNRFLMSKPQCSLREGLLPDPVPQLVTMTREDRLSLHVKKC